MGKIIKGFPIFIIYLFLIIFSNSKTNLYGKTKLNNGEKLLFVWEHFRHGARGPYTLVDPVTWLDYIGVKWESQGELTPIGMRMHYLLGVATKKKYQNFLSKQYDPKELFIISSDFNRTIMSGLSNLQGIYDNSTSFNLTDDMLTHFYMPDTNYSKSRNDKIEELGNKRIQGGINIFSENNFYKEAHLFKINDAEFCPGIKKYLEEARSSQQITELFNDISKRTNDTFGEQIFKFMNVSGVENPNFLFDFSNLFYICDTFVADYVDNREMTHIKNTGLDLEAFYQNSLNVSFLSTYYGNNGYPITKIPYIVMSPLFRSLFDYMDKRIDLDKKGKPDIITSKSPRFVIVSGHDSTVSPNDLFLKEEFDIDFDRAVYATSVTYELWKNEGTNTYSIHYLINQEEKKIFDYDTFKNKVLSKIYTQKQIDNICNGNSDLIEEGSIYKILFFIITGLVIDSFALLIFIILKTKQKNE